MRVSHHVPSPHIQPAALHHSRVPAPLPGHQLREVALEARIHDRSLFLEKRRRVFTIVVVQQNKSWLLVIIWYLHGKYIQGLNMTAGQICGVSSVDITIRVYILKQTFIHTHVLHCDFKGRVILSTCFDSPALNST